MSRHEFFLQAHSLFSGAAIFGAVSEFANTKAGIMILGAILSLGTNIVLRYVDNKLKEKENG